jgi:hypothetical protein
MERKHKQVKYGVCKLGIEMSLPVMRIARKKKTF